jgi:thioester reductase-like protein
VFKQDESAYREPVTDAEKDFCMWFSEVLHMDKVSADANFFALGGTSLSASVIAMRAKDRGYNVVYADVFKAQTPATLAMLAMGETKGSADEETDKIKSYDYGKIDLSNNCHSLLADVRPGDIGSILITGALGFLGVHVLREYLLNYDGTVYCMVRGKNIERRLKSVYFYYFSEEADIYFKSGRLKMIAGDITDEETLKTVEGLPFDTLINCAAIVKHFVKDDSLLKTNVGGVKNLIRLCRKKGVRLIQTSTVSVAGEGLDGIPSPDKLLCESELYIGQMLDNAYIYSKFLAERAVLEAASEGLNAKVVRLGNLMGRSADGEFQINFRTNAFVRMLASYSSIGAVPYSLINAATDFSEIDMTARAILKLAGTDRKFNVFHPMNNHSVTYADIVYSMREYGMKIDMVEDDEFAELMMRAGDKAGALIAYSTREGQERRYMLGADCSFTTNALYRLDFKWPVTDEDYIVKMLRALNGMSMLK